MSLISMSDACRLLELTEWDLLDFCIAGTLHPQYIRASGEISPLEEAELLKRAPSKPRPPEQQELISKFFAVPLASLVLDRFRFEQDEVVNLRRSFGGEEEPQEPLPNMNTPEGMAVALRKELADRNEHDRWAIMAAKLDAAFPCESWQRTNPPISNRLMGVLISNPTEQLSVYGFRSRGKKARELAEKRHSSS